MYSILLEKRTFFQWVSRKTCNYKVGFQEQKIGLHHVANDPKSAYHS